MNIIGYASAVFVKNTKRDIHILWKCGHIHRTYRGVGKCLSKYTYAGHPVPAYVGSDGEIVPVVTTWKFRK